MNCWTLLLVIFLANRPGPAANCTAPESSIPNQWTIEVTIVQTALAALQVFGPLVSIWASDLFYKQSHSRRVMGKTKELAERRKLHKKIRRETNKDALLILNQINKYINQEPSVIKSDHELLDLLIFMKQVLVDTASDDTAHHEEESTE